MSAVCTFVFALFLCLSTVNPAVSAKGTGDALTEAVLKGNWENICIEAKKLDEQKMGPIRDVLMGHAYSHQARWKDAWEHFAQLDKCSIQEKESILNWAKTLCDGHKNSSLGCVLTGEGYARLQDYNKAIKCFDRALQVDPNSYLAYNMRGLLRVFQESYDKAGGDFDRAIQINPNFSDAVLNRGILCILTGQYDKAIEALTSILSLDPSFFLARNARGVAYTLLSRYDDALLDFKSTNDQVPQFSTARVNEELAVIMKNRGILAHELQQLASVSPKGVLRSITIVVGDKGLLDKGAEIVSEGVFKNTGIRPEITTNASRAQELSKNGVPVILQVEAAAPGTTSINPKATDFYKSLSTLSGENKVNVVSVGTRGMDNLANIAPSFKKRIETLTAIEPGASITAPLSQVAKMGVDFQKLKSLGTNVVITESPLQQGTIDQLNRNKVPYTVARIEPEQRGIAAGNLALEGQVTPNLFENRNAQRTFQQKLPDGSGQFIKTTTSDLIVTFANLNKPETGFSRPERSFVNPPSGVLIPLNTTQVREEKGGKVDFSSLLSNPGASMGEEIPDNPRLCYPFLSMNPVSDKGR